MFGYCISRSIVDFLLIRIVPLIASCDQGHHTTMVGAAGPVLYRADTVITSSQSGILDFQRYSINVRDTVINVCGILDCQRYSTV